jgi:hypothetical protein
VVRAAAADSAAAVTGAAVIAIDAEEEGEGGVATNHELILMIY